jgi:hypothetical protein
MPRSFTLVLSLAAAGLLLAAPAGATSHPKLIGTVGKGGAFKITLTNATGTLVKTLKAGTYTLVIHDGSPMHNYELDGPNGKAWTFTTPPFVGTKTITLTLGKGAYKAYCAPHESTMFQHFTVA